MNRFIAIYIYIFVSLFSIFYDAFLSKGNKYIIYDKNSVGITLYNITGTITWGLFIFLANYYKFHIIAFVLLAITIFGTIFMIFCDQLGIYLEPDKYSPQDKNQK